MIAVDEEYASDDTPVSPTSRIALIPPVSGGSGRMGAQIPRDGSAAAGNRELP